MKSLKFILLTSMLFVTTQAFAQFTTGGRGKSSSSSYSASYDYAPKTGYKGFLDFGYGLGLGDTGADRIQLTTSHGYQINPYIYAGVGVGCSYFTNGELFNVPIFANGRFTLPLSNSKVCPFFDYKIGYSAADVSGFYMAPSAGIRVAMGEKCGFNISIGYEMQKASFGYFYFYGDYYYDYGEETANCGAFNFKIGIDF